MFFYTALLIEPLAIKAICVIMDKGKGFQIFPIQYQMIWHFEVFTPNVSPRFVNIKHESVIQLWKRKEKHHLTSHRTQSGAKFKLRKALG